MATRFHPAWNPEDLKRELKAPNTYVPAAGALKYRRSQKRIEGTLPSVSSFFINSLWRSQKRIEGLITTTPCSLYTLPEDLKRELKVQVVNADCSPNVLEEGRSQKRIEGIGRVGSTVSLRLSPEDLKRELKDSYLKPYTYLTAEPKISKENWRTKCIERQCVKQHHIEDLKRELKG